MISLQYLKFSGHLSAFLVILSNAAYDLLFFLVMFFIITFGYAVAGYALFGSQMVRFKDITVSFLSLLRVLRANFDYLAMHNADPTLSGLFLVSYLVNFKIQL